MKLVECVPNFSEGRDRGVIDQIAGEISKVAGVKLLEVDASYDANRTVMTFAGSLAAVGEAAFLAIKKAAELIDMRRHKGAHPRIGATDVCPFVPLRDVTMEECVVLSREVAERVGSELAIPVYLYEKSATGEHRRRLADIRSGEYEGLRRKMLDPKWKPDYGPTEPNEQSGATVIGARPFLIAYNVNLNSRNVAHARFIAAQVREKKDGTGLKGCRAIGWEMPSYGCVQVSMNLTDYHATPPHVAFEEIRRIAREMGLRVTGSELVGLIPEEALLMAGRFYMEKQGRCGGLPAEELVRCAVQSLGLGDVAPFDPDAKIVERRLFRRPMAEVYVARYTDHLSSDSPTPGGGSAAATSGALGAALTAMVANLAYRRSNEIASRAKLAKTAIEAQRFKESLLDLALQDELAYGEVIRARSLPSRTSDEKEKKTSALGAAQKRATEIPLEVMRISASTVALLDSIVPLVPPMCISDAAVALELLRASSAGARWVVMINLKEGSIPTELCISTQAEMERLQEDIEKLGKNIEVHLGRIFNR